MRHQLKPGGLIIWTDGTPGILLERFDMYADALDGAAARRRVAGHHHPTWCWHIAFSGPAPRDYNEKWGAAEVNMLNLGMRRRAE